MAKRYKVKNWERYQHYKDRNPPWVKLHFELLTSEDWVTFSDASRVLAVACMLLASRNDGYVNGDAKYLKRVAYLNSDPDFTELLEAGFVVDASNMLADASNMLADASNMLADASNMLANDTTSVSVSSSVSDSASEGGVGEKSKPEDFVGPIQQSRHDALPDPLADFDGDTPKHARHFWGLFCEQYHGRNPLRNLHTEATHKELRHFAKAIHTHGEKAIKVLTDYYASPPREDKALNAYQIVCKLGLTASVETAPPWEVSKKKEEKDGKERMYEFIKTLGLPKG